ncbi:MAG: YceH family protein, partial [Bacteroidetes bacterium]|nr:YceH family protein [Bacteroidota bacterium]
METPLTPIAVRVLGVLIEKDLTTPDYYPMTLNSLTNGCNQKSNRDPVMELSEAIVQDGLDELIRHRMAGHASGAGSRAIKFRHAAAEHWQLSQPELAVLSVLLLRGPQTVGEIKGRTGRMAEFDDLEQVAAVLRRLEERDPPMCT